MKKILLILIITGGFVWLNVGYYWQPRELSDDDFVIFMKEHMSFRLKFVNIGEMSAYQIEKQLNHKEEEEQIAFCYYRYNLSVDEKNSEFDCKPQILKKKKQPLVSE